MSKYSRSGGKFSGNHTTFTPVACTVADTAHACDVVTRISAGFLKAGLKSANGKRRVKITIESRSSLLLSVRDNTSHQEIHVYATDLNVAKRKIATEIEEAGLTVSFGEDRNG